MDIGDWLDRIIVRDYPVDEVCDNGDHVCYFADGQRLRFRKDEWHSAIHQMIDLFAVLKEEINYLKSSSEK